MNLMIRLHKKRCSLRVSNSRFGISLLEMVVVMAVSTTVIGISSGLIILSLRVDRLLQEESNQHQSIGRFADHFRERLHQTPWDNIERDAETLLISAQSESESQQVYVWQPRQIRYEEIDNAGNRRHQERFQLPPHVVVSWELNQERRVVLAHLTVKPTPTQQQTDSLLPVTIVAHTEPHAGWTSTPATAQIQSKKQEANP